jgi:hypothetical protein
MTVALHRPLTASRLSERVPRQRRARRATDHYGAFALDPDGHDIEAVNHNR